LMDAYAMEAGQACHLVAMDRDAAIVVAHASTPGNWEFGIRIGARIELLTTGSGLTLLAFQDPVTTSELLARWEGTGNNEALARIAPELRGYREAGYRIGDSRQIAGISDISVPVLSPEGHALAVLTCPFIRRLDEGAKVGIDAALGLLRVVAERLSLS
jgi:DNA-binding IclR family transcriptional regulator